MNETEAAAEQESIYSFKFKWLLDLGYGITKAEQLAGSSVDLHELEALIENGCDLATASRILL